MLPPIFGCLAAALSFFLVDSARPEDIDLALMALVTVNAVAVGLSYALMKQLKVVSIANLRFASDLNEAEVDKNAKGEARKFALAAQIMLFMSLLGMALGIGHIAFSPEGPILPLLLPSIFFLVTAPTSIPFLGKKSGGVAEEFAKVAAGEALVDDEVNFKKASVYGATISQEFIAEPSAPFAHDLLDRKTYVKAFCSILLGQSGPVVFSVDADWGQGKTAFLEMCSAYLRSVDLESVAAGVVPFNAWTESYRNDPLLDIVSSLKRELTDHETEDFQDVLWSLRQQARVVASGGLAPEKKLDENYSFRTATIGFKRTLVNYVEKCGGKLIVLVDELDRCRPDYALGVLERMKHLFNVKGVVVAIAVNPDALQHSIARLYGTDVDAGKRFLSRAIDYRTWLPERGKENTEAFVASALGKNGLTKYFDEHPFLRKIFDVLLDVDGRSLRDIEQLASRVAIVSTSLPKYDGNPRGRAVQWQQAGMTLMVLRYVDEDAYRNLLRDPVFRLDAIQALRDAALSCSGRVAIRMQAILLFAQHEDLGLWLPNFESVEQYYGTDQAKSMEDLIREGVEQLSSNGEFEPEIRRLASMIEMTYAP